MATTNPLDPNKSTTTPNATTNANTGLFDTVPPAVTPPSAPTPATATAAQATATGFQAAPYTVDPAKGTVQGQMASIQDKGSDLNRLAARDAYVAANQRGLLNSSLAVGSAQDAVTKTALPIAQADAGIFNSAMTNTANVENAARQFGAAAENTASQTNAQLGTSANVSNSQEINKVGLAELDTQTRVALGNLDVAARMKLAAIDANSRTLIQTNSSASDMYNNTVKNITDISRDPNLTPAAKQAAVDSQLNLLNQGLQQLQAVSTTSPANINDLNISQFFSRYQQVAQMTPDQIVAERQRLQTAIDNTGVNTVQRRQAVDALNAFNALATQAQAANAPANTDSLKLGEGFEQDLNNGLPNQTTTTP